MATLSEILEDPQLEFITAPAGKIFTVVFGVPKKHRAALYYANRWAVTSVNRDTTKEALALRAVKSGRLPMPSDWATCERCSGTGRTHYSAYNGICFKCAGLGFIKRRN